MGMHLPIRHSRRTKRLRHPPRRGLGLLEVLVGMLLLAGSLVGTLAMQARLQQFAQHTRQQQDAIALASQLAVLLRAHGHLLAQAAVPWHWQATTQAPAPGSCSDTPCPDPQQQLAHALSGWQEQAASLLPQLRLQICPMAAHAPLPTDWSCPADSAATVLLIQLGWQHDAPTGPSRLPGLILPVALPRLGAP